MSPIRSAVSPRRGGRRRPVVAVVLLAAITASGCGSLASDREIVEGAGGTTVRLDDEQFNALRQGGGLGTASVPAGDGAAGHAPAPQAAGAADPSVAAPKATDTGNAATAAGTGKSAGSGASSSNTAAAPGAGVAPAASCKASLSPIVVGQVGNFSGVLGAVNTGARGGLAAWAKATNAKGGIACHPVSVIAADDGGDPSRAQAAVADLVKNKGAVALLASFVQLTYDGFRAGFEAAKVPAIGGDLASPNWFTSTYAFPQGADITAQAIGAYKQGTDIGKKKMAVLYCVESSVCLNLRKVTEGKGGAAEVAGSEVVYSSQVSLTQPDFTAQCQNAKNAGADMIAAAVDGSATIRIARSCKALNYFPMFATGAMAIGAQQALDPQVQQNTLSIASSVFPWTASDTPAQAAFQKAMKELTNLPPDGPASIAWTSGELLAKAITSLPAKDAEGAISADLVLRGLGTIKNETLGGLIAPLTFKPGGTAPVGKCVFYVLLTKQGWTAPASSKAVCVR